MILDAKNPVWADAKNTAINCEAKTEAYGWIPFTANPLDSEPYGVQLWEDLNAGKYGTIAPYATPIPTAQQNKNKAVQLLVATDYTSYPDVGLSTNNPYLQNQAEFLSYRNKIRAIAVNPIEGNVDWPVAPQEIWGTS